MDHTHLERAIEGLARVGEWRSSDAFGPPLEVPAGADRQTRLLGHTGRHPS